MPRLSIICLTSVPRFVGASGCSASAKRRTYKATSRAAPLRSHIKACGRHHSDAHNSASRADCPSSGHTGTSPCRPSAGNTVHSASPTRSRRNALGSGAGPLRARAPPEPITSLLPHHCGAPIAGDRTSPTTELQNRFEPGAHFFALPGASPCAAVEGSSPALCGCWVGSCGSNLSGCVWGCQRAFQPPGWCAAVSLSWQGLHSPRP